MSHTQLNSHIAKLPSNTLCRKIFLLWLCLLFSFSAGLQADEKRLGIVFSSTTATNFYDEFAYSQLFISLQGQARMAGIPFDLLTEDDLTNAGKLSSYDALVIPLMSHAPESKLALIEAALDEAVLENGVGLITAGDFLAYNENGATLGGNSQRRLQRYLGLTYNNSNNSVAITLNASATTHPAMKNYQDNEQIIAYEQIWLNSYIPVNGQAATTLATMRIDNSQYNAVLATTLKGRNVHFANDQVLADSHLAWQAIQWVIFGDQTPVTLKMGRMDNIFIGRNDMDQSMFAAQVPTVHAPLYDMLVDWKNQYNFVGSYYINVGDNPSNGEYTNWNVSEPLYSNYIALGNEIGTHTYTHPHHTSELNATQLEYEFNQSKLAIEVALGINVNGTAIPGNPEGLRVDEVIDPYFDYISGQYGDVGSGYPLGIGQLRPDLQARYFGLNMSGDYSLVQYRGLSAEQAEQAWQQEYLAQTRHSSQPVIHWLWHDYAPTTGTGLGYTKAMIENTIAFAAANGSEFTTVQDLNTRMDSFEAANYSVSGSNPVEVSVAANNIGDFSLQVNHNQVIKQVDGWYAYDEDQVFLPRDGGNFTVHLGDNQTAATRISALPMRAELISVNGNGVELLFNFIGKGEVSIRLHPLLLGNFAVTGADAQNLQGDTLTLQFNTEAEHSVAIQSTASNLAPQAFDQSIGIANNMFADIILQASDANSDSLSFSIVQQPNHGTLTGSGATQRYTPNTDFLGSDSFSFRVNDGELNSNIATVNIEVENVSANQAPLAQSESYQTLSDTNLFLLLKGSDPEGDTLNFQLVSQPDSGTLSGTPPNLNYTPNPGYSGSDSFAFTVSDGSDISDAASIIINVLPNTNNALSNPANDIAIDGKLDDWSGVTAFAPDPDDVSGAENYIDWRQAWMAHSASDLFIAYSNDVDVNLSWGFGFYLDTDASLSTGFDNGTGLGIDYLVEGEFLYAYTGSGNDWSWAYVGELSLAVQGKNVEIAIAKQLLGNPNQIRLYFAGNNAAYPGGSAEDFYPDGVFSSTASLRYFEYTTLASANNAPVASNQSVNLGVDEYVNLSLDAVDIDGDTLQYEIIDPPTHGTLSYVNYAEVSYTPNAGFVGIDQFTFRASDGSLQSNLATVNITVNDTQSGPVSNHVNGIQIDGHLSDWAGLNPFPADPDDIFGAENPIDWRQAWMAHSDSELYIAYINDQYIELSWGFAIYLDTDASAHTGFDNGTGIGADYVIEGEHLYQYTGSGGSDWSWQWLGVVNIAVQGPYAELSVAKSMLNQPSEIRLHFVGSNSAYAGGSAEDLYPDDLYNSSAAVHYFEYDASAESSHPQGPISTIIDEVLDGAGNIIENTFDLIDHITGGFLQNLFGH